MSELRRCPFCNSTPVFMDESAYAFSLQGVRLMCPKCKLITPIFPTYTELTAYWNTRYNEEEDDDRK